MQTQVYSYLWEKGIREDRKPLDAGNILVGRVRTRPWEAGQLISFEDLLS